MEKINLEKIKQICAKVALISFVAIIFLCLLRFALIPFTAKERVKHVRAKVKKEELVDTLDKNETKQKIYKNNKLCDANKEEIMLSVETKNKIDNKEIKKQFLRIDKNRKIDEKALEKYLEDKNVFKGSAKAFIKAGKENKIDPIYLVAHAMLETGYGTSKLAKGVEINGEKYYNFYGINAFDASPLYGGSTLAEKERWTNVEKGICGGAKWIAEKYIHRKEFKQKTLYTMKYNVLDEDNLWHMYATDIEWKDKIAKIMTSMEGMYKDNKNIYEVIVY